MMRRGHKARAVHDMKACAVRAEALADLLDPNRTHTAKDETTREVVKACDLILRATSRALSMMRVEEE